MTKALKFQHYPRAVEDQDRAPLVLLHGWGNDSRCWEPILTLLSRRLDVVVVDLPGFGGSPPCQSWQQVIAALADVLPQRFSLLGWSLGGMLAVQLAHQYPQRVEKLVTLASNATFIRRSNWKTAMPAGVFERFYQGFVADPEAGARQFAGLQAQGDRDERQLVRWFRQHPPVISPLAWLHGLDWLKQLDNRETLGRLKIPSLHLFGAGDPLVPAATAARIRGLSRRLRVVTLEDSGHAPHIARPREIADLVLEFLYPQEGGSDAYQLEKARIAESFGRAASSYDSVAQLQRQCGENLLALLPDDIQPRQVADMGCGTGHFTAVLASRFPTARCTGVDLAPGMVAHARQQREAGDRLRWLCSDAEALALPDDQFDLVFSNFTFQWCQDLPALMAEQWRVLKPGGILAFTTVGPRSLWQLREAWSGVDDHVHVNRFAPADRLQGAMSGQGLDVLCWRAETVTRYYRQLSDLTGELKSLGAHNLNRGRNTALTGRRQLLALKSAYEKLRTPQGLPADWEVFYVVARKAETLRG